MYLLLHECYARVGTQNVSDDLIDHAYAPVLSGESFIDNDDVFRVVQGGQPHGFWFAHTYPGDMRFL